MYLGARSQLVRRARVIFVALQRGQRSADVFQTPTVPMKYPWFRSEVGWSRRVQRPFCHPILFTLVWSQERRTVQGA
jgi:hypothetical protein